jgi:hypothetical protein
VSMKPLRWDLSVWIRCEEGHAFAAQTAPDFALDAPDDAKSSPVMLMLPVRCERCEKERAKRTQLRIV